MIVASSDPAARARLGRGVVLVAARRARRRRAPRCEVQIAARVGACRASARSSQHDQRDRLVAACSTSTRASTATTRFQAGTYDLRKNMGVQRRGRGAEGRPAHRLRHARRSRPGLWLKQIAARVGKLPGRSAQPFLEATQNNAVRSTFEPAGVDNLEGLLWPDTYKISADAGRDRDPADDGDRRSTSTRSQLGLANANVQGHGAVPDHHRRVADRGRGQGRRQDRPLIASVIYNRLAREHAAADRLDGDLRARQSRRPHAVRRTTCRSSRRTTRTCTPGLPPTPIGAVSDGVAAGRARARATRRTSTTCSPARTATTRSRPRYEQQNANIAAAEEGRRVL